PTSNWSTVEVIEMPRARSSSIQSDVTSRLPERAPTAPASPMAPENSNSFSVSVVFPASGWEMMANVRRRLASVAMASANPFFAVERVQATADAEIPRRRISPFATARTRIPFAHAHLPAKRHRGDLGLRQDPDPRIHAGAHLR